jgi:hypothetical protein
MAGCVERMAKETGGQAIEVQALRKMVIRVRSVGLP